MGWPSFRGRVIGASTNSTFAGLPTTVTVAVSSTLSAVGRPSSAMEIT